MEETKGGENEFKRSADDTSNKAASSDSHVSKRIITEVGELCTGMVLGTGHHENHHQNPQRG